MYCCIAYPYWGTALASHSNRFSIWPLLDSFTDPLSFFIDTDMECLSESEISLMLKPCQAMKSPSKSSLTSALCVCLELVVGLFNHLPCFFCVQSPNHSGDVELYFWLKVWPWPGWVVQALSRHNRANMSALCMLRGCCCMSLASFDRSHSSLGDIEVYVRLKGWP